MNYDMIIYKSIAVLDAEATGKRIGELIDASGLTNKALSKKLNVTVQAVHKWRHGGSLPDAGNLFALKQLLGVKMDDFFVAGKTIKQEKIVIDIEAEQDSASKMFHIMSYFNGFQRILLN